MLLPLLFWGILQHAAAQSDSLTLPVVQVHGSKVVPLFSTALMHRPDTALQLLTSTATSSEVLPLMGFFLKTYGSGSLATGAFRGTAAGHNTVVWNGFNIKNPMNGVIDFSLFPLSLTDELTLIEGGGSSLYGNGAIGATLMLNDQPDLRPGLHGMLNLRGGSFSDWRQSAALNFAKKNTAANLKLWHQAAANDFPLNPGGQRQQNARLKHFGLSQSNHLQLTARSQLSSFFWYQDARRQIPPSRTETNTHAQQDDQVLRSGARWNCRRKNSMSSAQLGYFKEQLLFFNDLIDSSRSQSNTWTASLNHQHYLPHNKLLLKVQGEHQQAHTRETGTQQRYTLAAVAGWKYYSPSENSFLELFLRQELVDGKAVPVTGSAGANWRLAAHLITTVRFSRSYNVPTFNDLYWQDAFAKGNPDLKPETGYGLEWGLLLQPSENVHINLRFHSTTVTHRILWAQFAGTWQPRNLDEVWSRGLSMKLAWSHRLHTWTFNHQAHLHLNRSSDVDNPSSQLIYTPVLTANYSVVAKKGPNSAVLQSNYNSRIFTTSDNNNRYALPPFALLNLHLMRHWKLGKHSITTALSINNFLNANYEIIKARPMPGRNFGWLVRWVFD